MKLFFDKKARSVVLKKAKNEVNEEVKTEEASFAINDLKAPADENTAAT